MVEFQRKDFYSYEDFLEIMRLLRAPGGCPWDREQTHSSIRRNFLEETYEVLDAIDHDDASGMCEELGDVLMQVAFHAQIEAERGRFTMANVVDGVARKLVYRHPHVFGGAMAADNSEQVLANWETLKRREKVAIQLLIPCVDELLEKSLPDEVEKDIEQALLSFPGVSEPHHLRTRRIGSYCAIEVHVRMDGGITLEEAHTTATAIEHKLKTMLGEGTLINIHVEPKK